MVVTDLVAELRDEDFLGSTDIFLNGTLFDKMLIILLVSMDDGTFLIDVTLIFGRHIILHFLLKDGKLINTLATFSHRISRHKEIHAGETTSVGFCESFARFIVISFNLGSGERTCFHDGVHVLVATSPVSGLQEGVRLLLADELEVGGSVM